MSRAPKAPVAGAVGALLSAGYAVLAIAATARSMVQISTRLGDAPMPYLLSAMAALTYLIVGWALHTGRRRATIAACAAELGGVLTVGSWSVLRPGAFPDQTVWSGYGIGYGLVPLLLPVLTLWWLRQPRPGHHRMPRS